jgi:chitin disaccharide deacetylase
MADTSLRLGIPLRRCTPAVSYCGDFHGQDETGAPFPGGISLRAFVRLLDRVRPGITELGCHPGFGNAAPTAYRDERAREVEVLCDPRARTALCRCGIELISFRSVR